MPAPPRAAVGRAAPLTTASKLLQTAFLLAHEEWQWPGPNLSCEEKHSP